MNSKKSSRSWWKGFLCIPRKASAQPDVSASPRIQTGDEFARLPSSHLLSDRPTFIPASTSLLEISSRTVYLQGTKSPISITSARRLLPASPNPQRPDDQFDLLQTQPTPCGLFIPSSKAEMGKHSPSPDRGRHISASSSCAVTPCHNRLQAISYPFSSPSRPHSGSHLEPSHPPPHSPSPSSLHAFYRPATAHNTVINQHTSHGDPDYYSRPSCS